MVRSGRYSRDPVCARRETISDVSSEPAVDSNIIETLEEGEDMWFGVRATHPMRSQSYRTPNVRLKA